MERLDADDAEHVEISFRRLFSYIKPYWRRIAFSLVALLFSSATGLVFPYVIQNLIDGVLVDGDLAQLNRITGALIAIFAVGFVFNFAQRYLMEYIGERVVIDIREQLYEHLLTLSISFFDERRSGEIVSRLASDVTLVRSALTNNISTMVSQSLTLIGAVVIVFVINWRMSLFILVLAPVMAGIGALFGMWVRRISTEIQDELAESSTIVEEVVQSVRVVKSFVREQFEIARYRASMDRTFNAAMRLTRVRSAFGPLMFTIMFMGIVFVLWFGGREVIAGRLTAGGLTSFLFYLMFIAGAFGAFTGLYTQLQEAMGATRRIFEMLDTNPEVEDKPDAETLSNVEGRITFEDVSFAYDERASVINNISLDIAPGEVLALVGPSGAGKSTLVSLITRFWDPTTGTLRIDGKDMRDVTQHSLRDQIAIVPQETILFGGTVRENILYGDLNATEAEMTQRSEGSQCARLHHRIPRWLRHRCRGKGCQAFWRAASARCHCPRPVERPAHSAAG